jgi:short-subunit dehydrogenase
MEIPPLFNLTEKVALVSGASRGIGAAIAQILAEFGANVILTSRRAENLKEVETSIATMVILHR